MRSEAAAGGPAHIRLEARAVLAALLSCIAALVAIGFFVVLMRYRFDHGGLLGFSGRFDLNTEANVPSYFSALQIGFAALILLMIARAKRARRDPFARHWSVLCGIFAFLSLDEAAQLHERTREPMLALFDLTGVWAYAWFIPYGVLVAVFLLAYWRFYRHLPVRVRLLFAIACVVYVVAAIGMELLQHYFALSSDYGSSGKLYAALCYSFEEGAEMLGIALFVYALLRYAAAEVGIARIEFSARRVCDRSDQGIPEATSCAPISAAAWERPRARSAGEDASTAI